MVCFSRPTSPTLELSPNQINYIKRNARSAFDEFLIHWEPLIHIFANKQRHFRTDHEDLCQVGRLALYTAIQTYTPGKSAFCTYATKVIRNAMRDLHRRNRRSLEETCATDDEQAALYDAECIEYRDHLVEMEQTAMIKQWRAGLTNRDRYIVMCLYDRGLSMRAVALHLGITAARISQIVSALRQPTD